MTTERVIIAPDHVRRCLQQEYEANSETGYKPLADKYGVSAAMIMRIIKDGYVPKTYKMLKKLGYVPTCPNCGHEFSE